MNIVLWILQVLVALAFLMHGLGMLNPPKEARPGMSYIQDLPPNLRRFIGVVEILGAIGLVLPPLVNVLPILTPIAAAGLVIIMVLAAIYHIPRRENPNIVLNLVLGVLALFVVYGRFVLLPF
jgi:uncharacterized membrane protein YphA (DoxX/SURF4 family)